MPVCYRNIVQIGDTSTNYQLQPGDRVFIPKRPWWQAVGEALGCKKQCDPCDQPQNGCPAPPLDCSNCQNNPIPLPPGMPPPTVFHSSDNQAQLPRFASGDEVRR